MNNKFKIPWSARSHFFTNKEISKIIKVIKTADVLSQGVWLERFEKKFLNFIKSKGKAFGVTSGASAIEIAAALLNLKKNDEIIIPSHTYCATALPFTRYNCKIKWADINSESFCIDPISIKKLITKKTKAIVAVHLYGSPCDINEIKKICKKEKIILVEDCAQSLGSKVNNKHVGTFGDLSIFSFHQQKNMTTLGEGGMLVVNNKKFQKYILGLRHNGHKQYSNKKKYWKPAMVDVDQDLQNITPFNFPMTEIQACSGFYLLDRINKLNKKRNLMAKKIINSLKGFNFIKFQKSRIEYTNSHHLLPAYIDTKIKKINKDRFIEMMSSKYKIQIIVQFHPLHKYKFFKKRGDNSYYDLSKTDFFFKNMVSFPIHVWMSKKNLDYMITSTQKTLKILTEK
jgi:perosamine synthetase